MSSRWQANKIGLINFWYYDEQEFPFVKGRMLLRGSNGSGKSVTMQSVVPLLLDGNMSPERLDPFGSRDRKMSSYLLEEDDDREERTGYLYLEFKRQESSTYLTVGMGIRARRGKPLDKWYFSLADGRRIGKDFFLYREVGEKITLSKKELENRIGAGGQVFERQQDYMEYVNRHIFGFETAEEYKEMIDLLIQLRTPKLSKDFKPSVINEILSDSLQPLSDEDLRPMAEAIENMDTLNMNLKARTEGLQAAEKIQRVLGKYDRLTLYRRAHEFIENKRRLEKLEKEAAACEKETAACMAEKLELEQERERLAAKKEAMDKELDSLKKSDAVALNARKLELVSQQEDLRQRLTKKEDQLREKEERWRDTEAKYKQEEEKEFQKEKELRELLEEMEAEAEEMSFQEHAFFQAECLEDLKAKISFAPHRKQFEATREKIRKGEEILREADIRQRQAEEALKRREKQQQETDAAQRKATELGAVLIEMREEWKEKLYAWNGQNQELLLPQKLLQEFASFAEDYGKGSDFAEIRRKTANVWIQKKTAIDALLCKQQETMDELEKACEETQKELKEWENNKEPEPLRTEAVIKNRQRLKEKGIPYLEMYKLLEFSPGMDQMACNRMEEALLEMGILDALVVEEQYEDEVLKLDPGCCDRYLFARGEQAEESILDVLELDAAVNDIFLNQKITGILSRIAYIAGKKQEPENGAQGCGQILGDSLAHTVITESGTYQIGALTGTVTGMHEAGFIGAAARERNRQAKMEACRQRLQELLQEKEDVEAQIKELKERAALLETEYHAFPEDTDMREASDLLEEAEQRLKTMRQEGVRLEEEYLQLARQYKEMQKEALLLAEKLYLPCTLASFSRAAQAAEDYGNCLGQLDAGQEMYRHIVLRLEELNDYMESLDEDMDQIRYESQGIRRQTEKNRQEYESVIEQLKLTDYEQIRQRLDDCMEWLGSFQGRVEKCTQEHTRREEGLKLLVDQAKQLKEAMQGCYGKNVYLELCYRKEKALGYVVPAEENEDESEETAVSAERVEKLLEPQYREVQLNDVMQDLNRVFFENRGFLGDYQPRQTEIFQELADNVPEGCHYEKRYDIYARYQGVQISFHQLISCLEKEIEGLKELIRAGDRELFEDILANTVSRKIRGKINGSNAWVEKMNALMGEMNTSSGLKLSLRWRSRTAETEDQLDTKDLVELLKKDYRMMREDEAARLSRHFRSKVELARRNARDGGGMISFYQVMKETLDYRKWFEFQLFSRKAGEKQKELTNNVFGTFSGGEKAMAMYIPLFSAVVAKYQGGNTDAPRLISLDEAFAGVDNRNIRDMFRLMTEFEFDFIINSQVLWGDADTLDALAIYQLIRPENAKFVTVMPYLWNGKQRKMLENEKQVEEQACYE